LIFCPGGWNRGKAMTLDALERYIGLYPDFPKAGILFRDISPMLASPAAMDMVVDAFTRAIEPFDPDYFAGMESRGFLFSTLMAKVFGRGSVMIRKPGKLPGPLIAESYALEYGENILTKQQDAPVKGKRVVLMDDLLATGGTIAASAALLRRLGAEPVATAVVIELAALKGREAVSMPIISLLRYDDQI